MTKTTNVISFEKQIDTEIEREQEKARLAFSALWANYLRAKADTVVGRSDKAMDRACDIQTNAMWRIIEAPAAAYHQLDWKFDLMRELLADLGGVWSDNRLGRLLESIRRDVKHLSDR